MGKGKCCTPDERKAIVALKETGLSYNQIAAQINRSKTFVVQAVQHFRSKKTTENVPRRAKKRKTTDRIDRKIVNISKTDPRKSSKDIHNEITDQFGVQISRRTVQNRLIEAGLYGRVSRKKPLVTPRQRKNRIAFARSHASWTEHQWKFILWSDETKICRIGSDGRRYVRRPKNAAFNPKFVIPVVKHGGGSINVWGCFSWNGVGPIHRIQGIMTKEIYIEILENVMLPWAEENLPVIWKFQQDNDPKHTAKLTEKWFQDNSINVLEWASSSADLNPIEHLWKDVKDAVGKQNITNLDDLYQKTEAAWKAIPVDRCRRLIRSMQRRCVEVLRQKGFATKY